jgi:hypothetical protein
VCSGNTAEVAGIFAGLQRSLNALANKVAGMESLGVVVDGKIGPKTVAAVKKAVPALFPNQPIPQDANTVSQMAPALADAFFTRSTTVANYAPPSIVPPQTDSSGLPVPIPDQEVGPPRKGLHWAWWVGGAVAVIGIGYLGYRWLSGGGTAMSGSDDEHDYGEAGEDFIDV